MSKKVLNTKSIEAIKLEPAQKELDVYDAQQSNLVLRVRPAKQGSYSYAWLFRYSKAGRRRKINLGAYPAVSVAAAREAARRHLEQLELGIDPRAAALVAKATFTPKTVGELFDFWFEEKIKNKRKEKSVNHCAQIFRDHIFEEKAFIDFPLSQLKPKVIEKLIDKINEKGKKRTTALAIQLMKLMFRWATFHEYIERDPIYEYSSKDWVKLYSRDRYLKESELILLFKGMRQARIDPQFIHAISLILATSNRSTETVLIEKRHIHLNDGYLIIPKDNQKETNAKPRDHIVFLSDFAKKHIKSLLSLSGDSRYLIPNLRSKNNFSDKPINSKTLMQQLARHDGESNQAVSGFIKMPFGKITIHDLRRTGSTILSELNFNPYVITLMQNHKISDKIISTYQAGKLLQLRKEATNLLGEVLEKCEAQALHELRTQPHEYRVPWSRNSSESERIILSDCA